MLLYIIFTLTLCTGYFVVNQSFNYGLANGFTNTAFLSGIASVAAVFNAGRFLWGYALDLSTFKCVFGILLVTQIFLSFTIFFVCQSPFLYAVWICALMFCEGALFVLAPNILLKIYGDKATHLYGFFKSFAALCSIILIILQSAFLTDSLRSYNAFFIVNGLLSCISLAILTNLFNEDKYISIATRQRMSLNEEKK